MPRVDGGIGGCPSPTWVPTGYSRISVVGVNNGDFIYAIHFHSGTI